MKTIYIILIVTLALLTTACSERIDLNLESGDPKIVIYGCLTDTLAHQQVTISSSTPYFEYAHNPTISGATVSILTSEGEKWTLSEKEVPGVYRTDGLRAGKPGVTYALTVGYDFNKDGLDEFYEASATMLPPFVIDSVALRAMKEITTGFFTVNLYGDEPLGEDFYIYKFFVNDSLTTPLSKYGQMEHNDLLDGKYMEGLMIYYFADSVDMSQYNESDRRETIFVNPGNTITIEANRIEKGYSRFITQCIREQRGENPLFGGPPSNIESNISNGAIGYFTAFSVSQTKAVIPDRLD